MNFKTWTESEVRALARQTIEGKHAVMTARGAYFRALLETAQAELGGKADQVAQRAAVKVVHHRFYPVVQAAIATDERILEDGFARKAVALERNRRLTFARSSYGTIQGWLRAEGHDLMKLDAKKVTKGQLAKESPPTKKHEWTPRRIQARAKKFTSGLLDFLRQLAKTDQAQANAVALEVSDKLVELVKAAPRMTVEAKRKPLRIGTTRTARGQRETRVAKSA